MADPLLSPWSYDRETGWTDEDPMTPFFNGMFKALARRWKALDDEAGIPEDRRVEVGTVGLHSDRDKSGVADRAEKELEDPARFAKDDGSVYQRFTAAELDAEDAR